MRKLFVWYGLYENLPFGRNRNKQQNLAHFDNNDSCIFDTFEVETTQLFEPSFLEITQLFSKLLFSVLDVVFKLEGGPTLLVFHVEGLQNT